MIHITVSDEQAKLIARTRENIEIRDPAGRHLGYIAHDFTDEEIALARKALASPGPRYSTAEVLEHLRSLESK